jgi:uncharacterized protein (DUF2252 family)
MPARVAAALPVRMHVSLPVKRNARRVKGGARVSANRDARAARTVANIAVKALVRKIS